MQRGIALQRVLGYEKHTPILIALMSAHTSIATIVYSVLRMQCPGK